MTVEINHKKLYYNYYTSGKFLIINIEIQVSGKILQNMETSDASLRAYVSDGCISKPISVLRYP
jgi:hypothetical protein